MQFSQHIVFYAADPGPIQELLDSWSAEGSAGEGFVGGRLMRFRDKPGRYVLQADFESFDAAEASNERPETQAWAASFAALIDSDAKYENLDVLAVY